ncbi:MAG: DNA polymerase/3'-5' exonuclease PolX [Alphaproteobacteria bacterium]|nr:DNA polymerase/3'-5' exonuclease PolX [Alphaproteobacteria bacterium]
MHNDEIAGIFEQLADLLEIDGANPFRVRAYRNAARLLRGLPEEAADMLARGEDLSQLPSIGEDLAGKIAEIVETGRLETLQALKKTTPAGLAELTRIPGLGPKRVRLLRDALGVKSPAGLRRAAMSGKLAQLPGFGVKTQANIRAYFDSDRSGEKRTRLADAEKVAQRLVAYLEGAADRKHIVVAGSFRRSCETVGDLDIVVASASPQKVMDRFAAFDEIATVAGKGKTRATVRLRSGLQVDIRAMELASFGAACVYFTGSKAHCIALRKRGVSKGLKVNEYGVFRRDKSIAGETEKDVYAALGLPLIPPELREDRGEIEAAEKGKLPRLVALGDIRGDLHVHTKASDGRDDIRAMAKAARARGYDYLAICDHTKHARIAHGLTPSRLERQIDRIDALNEELSGIRILKSSEVDILADGSLDMPDSVLAKLDLVVGAVHFDFDLTPARQTERIIRAMDHPAFSILAHPTCRLIGARDPMRVQMERLMDAALERGCYLEANGQPERLDLNDVYCRMAKERGLKLALSTDAHSTEQLDFMRFSLGQARRGWLSPGDVINTRSWRDLKSLLKR